MRLHGREDSYEVGYGKPPRQSQFRKGISGNPAGRPKGSKNLATVLQQALQEKVVIREDGRRKTVTKLEAAVKQLVDKASSGDMVALRHLIALAGSVEAQATDAAEQHVPEADLNVMRGLLQRLEGTVQE
jgi:Family of unknown function (DUF5681)